MDIPLSTELAHDAVIINKNLRITFHRTVRVPDNHQTSFLPPDLGTFQLKKVGQYENKLRPEMVAKGGLFFPMYRKWSVQDDCKQRANIKQSQRRCG